MPWRVHSILAPPDHLRSDPVSTSFPRLRSARIWPNLVCTGVTKSSSSDPSLRSSSPASLFIVDVVLDLLHRISALGRRQARPLPDLLVRSAAASSSSPQARACRRPLELHLARICSHRWLPECLHLRICSRRHAARAPTSRGMAAPHSKPTSSPASGGRHLNASRSQRRHQSLSFPFRRHCRHLLFSGRCRAATAASDCFVVTVSDRVVAAAAAASDRVVVAAATSGQPRHRVFLCSDPSSSLHPSVR